VAASRAVDPPDPTLPPPEPVVVEPDEKLRPLAAIDECRLRELRAQHDCEKRDRQTGEQR